MVVSPWQQPGRRVTAAPGGPGPGRHEAGPGRLHLRRPAAAAQHLLHHRSRVERSPGPGISVAVPWARDQWRRPLGPGSLGRVGHSGEGHDASRPTSYMWWGDLIIVQPLVYESVRMLRYTRASCM